MKFTSTFFAVCWIAIVVGEEVTFLAVSDSPYTERLYGRVKSDAPPSEDDPATTNARARKHICGQIVASGFFVGDGMKPINWNSVRNELKRAKYSNIFSQFYEPSNSKLKRLLRSFKYTNIYTPRTFELIHIVDDETIFPTPIRTTEHVFACLLRNWNSGDLYPFYVSKLYNVPAEDGSHTAARFVFSQRGRIILAEGPAILYATPDYNVELHYLYLRSNHNPESAPHSDPVCKLASRTFQNQQHRLCAVVMASYYSGGSIFGNPDRSRPYSCDQEEISFRTPEGVEKAAGESYREWMTICRIAVIHPGGIRLKVFYISRAYTSHRVFVYSRTSPEQPLYLENLATQVSVVHDFVGFDDVE